MLDYSINIVPNFRIPFPSSFESGFDRWCGI